MLKRGRAGQNWSLEVIIALSVFLVIFILATAFMYYLPRDSSFELQSDLRYVFSALETEVSLQKDGVIDDTVLQDLTMLSCDDIRSLLQVTGAVCIHLESLDGNLVQLDDGSFGVGCDDISFSNGFACGVRP